MSPVTGTETAASSGTDTQPDSKEVPSNATDTKTEEDTPSTQSDEMSVESQGTKTKKATKA